MVGLMCLAVQDALSGLRLALLEGIRTDPAVGKRPEENQKTQTIP